MITAITCNRRDAYNRFVTIHEHDLADAYGQITSHFTRTFGSNGEAQRDSFITEIANVQSQNGERDPGFCRNMQPLIYQALTLRTTYEMSRFVADWNLISPYPMAICRY